jgi:hypothetical protein
VVKRLETIRVQKVFPATSPPELVFSLKFVESTTGAITWQSYTKDGGLTGDVSDFLSEVKGDVAGTDLADEVA